LFSWTDNATNNGDDVNIFEKPILILLDIINGNFRINFDIRSGGDGRLMVIIKLEVQTKYCALEIERGKL